MSDFYSEYRDNMISTMQQSLRQIRNIMGMGVQEFGDYLGLTRQSVNNLETLKSRMSASQYLAVAALLDCYVKRYPEAYELVTASLRNNDTSRSKMTFNTIEMHSLTAKWFLCFPGKEPSIASLKECFTLKNLVEIASAYHVFLDESAFIMDGGRQAIESMEKVMLQGKNKLILPMRVAEKLQEMAENGLNRYYRKAREGLKLIMDMQGRRSLELRGEVTDTTVEDTFFWVFAKFKSINRLALLTIDQKLAVRINTLNQNGGNGFEILLIKFDEDGNIRKWKPEELQVTDKKIEDELNSDENNEGVALTLG